MATQFGNRECGHKVRRKSKPEKENIQEISEDQPINIIKEETEDELKELDKLSRPVTSSSRPRSSSSTLLSSRPSSRYTRPGTGRTSFDSRPGTGVSRRTISRASSRKSRPASSGARLEEKQSSDSESDNEEITRARSILHDDFGGVDITDDKAFDTDLEIEGLAGRHQDLVGDLQTFRLAYCMDETLKFHSDINDIYKIIKHYISSDEDDEDYNDNVDDIPRPVSVVFFNNGEQTTAYDHTGRTAYIESCKKMGVVPASYFLRHMHDSHLSMKHHGLGIQGIKAVATSLVSNTAIVTLDLSDNFLGYQGGLALCEMLKENCFITNLNLSDNRLGPKCAENLTKVLQQNLTLLHINLAGNDFDDSTANAFAEVILNSQKIESMNLSHNLFGEYAGMVLGPAISENSTMKELDLSWNSIRRRGAVAVAAGIKSNVFLKKMNLSWNGFGLEGSIALMDCLKNNSVLEELDLTNNRITTEGAVLIGKGISANETLKVLKMGKNPMQSAGCYGICAAILRNPNSVVKEVDFSDVLVNNDFNEIFKQVKEQIPDIKMKHGGMEPPKKPKAPVHPMVKLANYIQKNNLRLVDFFNKFDKDGSMSVTYEEFEQGIEETGIKLSSEEIKQLLLELDADGDGEINYSELVIGHTGFQEKRDNINTVLTVASQPRPLTT